MWHYLGLHEVEPHYEVTCWWSLWVSDIDNILHVNMIPDTSSRGHGARATLLPVTAITVLASHWSAAPPSLLWLALSLLSHIPGPLWTQQLAEKLLVTFPLPWATILPRHHSVKLISRNSGSSLLIYCHNLEREAAKNNFKNIFRNPFSWSSTETLCLCDLLDISSCVSNPQVDPPSFFLCCFREHDMGIFLPKIFPLGCSEHSEGSFSLNCTHKPRRVAMRFEITKPLTTLFMCCKSRK